jgi:hypothetical protein
MQHYALNTLKYMCGAQTIEKWVLPVIPEATLMALIGSLLEPTSSLRTISICKGSEKTLINSKKQRFTLQNPGVLVLII